jgi:hypothetical protein
LVHEVLRARAPERVWVSQPERVLELALRLHERPVLELVEPRELLLLALRPVGPLQLAQMRLLEVRGQEAERRWRHDHE